MVMARMARLSWKRPWPSRRPDRWLWSGVIGGLGGVGVLIFVLHTLVASQSRPQALPRDGRWAPTNLRSAVNALLGDPAQPTSLVAGTASGVWRSRDGGVTWQPERRGPREDVYALAAPVTRRVIFAGGSDGALYESGGSGDVTWRSISPPLGGYPIFSVAASPDGRTVLAGSLGALYRGEDDGNHWRWRRVAGTGDAAITSLLWAPWGAHLAFASVVYGSPPVLVSHNGGRTWRSDSAGLPPTLPTQALRVADTRRQQVLLSTMGAGVWRQSAAGPWRDISTGLPHRHAMPLFVAPGEPAVLYAGTMGYGVYEKQGEAVWQHLGGGLSGETALVLSLAASSGPHPALLAGTARGLFRYVPSG